MWDNQHQESLLNKLLAIVKTRNVNILLFKRSTRSVLSKYGPMFAVYFPSRKMEIHCGTCFLHYGYICYMKISGTSLCFKINGYVTQMFPISSKFNPISHNTVETAH